MQYRIRIDAPNDITFHINDRYSNLRLISSTIKRQLPSNILKIVPMFPPKKLFGGNKESFIEERKQRLNHFFNKFLEIPEVASNEFILVFFEQQVESQDALKFKRLIEYLKDNASALPQN